MRNDSTLMHIMRLTVTLLAICAVVAAVLAGVNMITKDKIAEIQTQKIEKAIILRSASLASSSFPAPSRLPTMMAMELPIAM